MCRFIGIVWALRSVSVCPARAQARPPTFAVHSDGSGVLGAGAFGFPLLHSLAGRESFKLRKDFLGRKPGDLIDRRENSENFPGPVGKSVWLRLCSAVRIGFRLATISVD